MGELEGVVFFKGTRIQMGLVDSPALHCREGPNRLENVKGAGRCLSLGTDTSSGSCDSDLLLLQEILKWDLH